MKSLNKKSKEVFMKLVDLLNADGRLKIKKDGYMDLSMERLATDVKTPLGTATIYSLAHYYVQEGDLMSDPDMQFICVDLRTATERDLNLVAIYPQNYTLSAMSHYNEAICLETNKYSPSIYRGLCDFANIWLQNIVDQGFFSKDAIVASNF